jgi:streptogramin lyase
VAGFADPASNTTETIDLGVGVGDHAVAVAVDDCTGFVWAPVSISQNIRVPFVIDRIDPAAGAFTVVATAGGESAGSLAAGSGSVWFASDDGSVGDPRRRGRPGSRREKDSSGSP